MADHPKKTTEGEMLFVKKIAIGRIKQQRFR